MREGRVGPGGVEARAVYVWKVGRKVAKGSLTAMEDGRLTLSDADEVTVLYVLRNQSVEGC